MKFVVVDVADPKSVQVLARFGCTYKLNTVYLDDRLFQLFKSTKPNDHRRRPFVLAALLPLPAVHGRQRVDLHIASGAKALQRRRPVTRACSSW